MLNTANNWEYFTGTSATIVSAYRTAYNSGTWLEEKYELKKCS